MTGSWQPLLWIGQSWMKTPVIGSDKGEAIKSIEVHLFSVVARHPIGSTVPVEVFSCFCGRFPIIGCKAGVSYMQRKVRLEK